MTGNSICEELKQKVNKPEKAAAERDIATQKQIEETLRESESKFRYFDSYSIYPPKPLRLPS